MYVPQHFRIDDPVALYGFMQQNSFATLVSVHDGLPFATPLPVWVGEGVLRMHLAKANPQWSSLISPSGTAQEVLLLFQGPHAFVSPSWYQQHPAVPTWNYLTVHAYGRPQIIEDPQEVRALLNTQVQQYETQWSLEGLPEAYLQGMVRGIVALEVEITRLEGKFKLSQNRSAADRAQVIAHLAASPHPLDKAVAQAMQEREAHATR